MSIGVPIKVLHEAEGHIVTCETSTGEVYRGKLIEAEDNMNCQMAQITVTYRDGRVAQLGKRVYQSYEKRNDGFRNSCVISKLIPVPAARGRGRAGGGRGNVFQKRR
ncbi:hypothetical protein BaRGS_00018056 [Batillaria attramentaria]|uniref:Small nuclear ribonucleoprotein Sm D3 n=1 Tax=Batillaria attramentaria TaxID=370345 RepID=A0ABD0KTT6_9CAEN